MRKVEENKRILTHVKGVIKFTFYFSILYFSIAVGFELQIRTGEKFGDNYLIPSIFLGVISICIIKISETFLLKKTKEYIILLREIILKVYKQIISFKYTERKTKFNIKLYNMKYKILIILGLIVTLFAIFNPTPQSFFYYIKGKEHIYGYQPSTFRDKNYLLFSVYRYDNIDDEVEYYFGVLGNFYKKD